MNPCQNSVLESPDSVRQTSVSEFCSFVNERVRDAEDPLSTAVVCEYQAEAVRLTRYDVNPETLNLLLDTLLNTLEYMGKQWHDHHNRGNWKKHVLHLFSPHPGLHKRSARISPASEKPESVASANY
ncbi:hypothetical protein CSA56_15210 [candidate division KSB3 bacterium]|uniref:Uncharacterized protein n=1 Tax=candidate division KSB3 bacterium TaxID=2044937 RepID=A0A2G6KCL4_9BACT|nr:MAG: hypothetical protein CSA56_15210 [candidate division KSB3 bacterium]